MRSIEEQIGITGTARDGFRSDITSYMMRALRRKEKLTYDCYAPLKEAIEAKLIFSVREMSRIVTKAKSRDDKQQRKYGDVVKTLIDTYGYNEDSAEEILKFAANHLWRDS
jgi:serine protein kinase